MESDSDGDSTDDKVVHVSSSAKVQIHEFASLPAESNVPHNINKIYLLGHKWILQLYPGGVTGAKDGYVSMFIHRETASVDDMNVELKFIVKNVGEEKMTYNFRRGSTLHLGKGSYNFALRSKVLESLSNNSSLVVEVNMKLIDFIDSIEPSLPFVPENPTACEVIRGMWGDAASANVTIEVGGRQFHAHRFILENCSTTLAGLLESAGDQTAHIQISDVSADIFHLLHKYMYGHTIFDDVTKSRSREIIDAADKYGIVTLKLEAEAVLVEATIFTMENVMELMQYAESKNCSLLKEAALDYIALNKVEAIEKLSFNDAPGTIAKDILVAVSRGEKNEDELTTMRISELRRMAHSKRLNVDGSREVLIAALKKQRT